MKKLRLRFIDDMSIPVTVVEDPYFEYQLGLCGEKGRQWGALVWGIHEEYDGNEEQFLQDFYQTRESMIQTLGASEKWKSEDISLYNHVALTGKTKEIYNEEWAGKGKHFASIDLTKANVQAFAHVDPDLFGWEEGQEWKADILWKNFVWKHIPEERKTLRWYCEESKYLRQVVFGNVNPKKQIGIEKWMIQEQAKVFLSSCPGAETVMVGNDEVIFEIPQSRVEGVSKRKDIDTKLKIFQLEMIPFETTNGNRIKVFKRVTPGGTYDYKCIPKNYYPQIIGLLEGREPDPEGKDLVFYYEKEIAKFVGRLKQV